MTSDIHGPVEDRREYRDIELLTEVVKYNKQKYLSFINKTEFKINKDYEKILNARYQKLGRIKRRFLYLLTRYKNIWFCTFTFNQKMINKCERTKRDSIKKFLNNYDFKYILNIDYGKSTHRQHFHCILATDSDIDVNQYFQENLTDNVGFNYSNQMYYSVEDFKKYSSYINKLVNHCLKATTNRQRIVYNFKGYNNFCPTSHDITIQYKLELFLFENVTLLDKGDINGNFSLENS